MKALDGDARRLAKDIKKKLHPGSRERLRAVALRYPVEEIDARVARWLRAVELAGGRAGLLACGDVAIAAETRFVRRRSALLACAAIALAALGLWHAAADAEREAPLRVVNEVLEAAQVRSDETPGQRDQRLQNILQSHFEDPVTVRHVDMPRAGAGRRALLIWGRLLVAGGPVRLGSEQVQVGLSADEKAATVRLGVVLSSERQGHAVEQRRPVEVRLRRREGTWKIQRVDVEARAHDLPEARP
jgi:hypothetical protein